MRPGGLTGLAALLCKDEAPGRCAAAHGLVPCPRHGADPEPCRAAAATRRRTRREQGFDLESLALIARNLGHTAEVDSTHVRVHAGQNAAAEINRAAMRAGITLTEIAVERSSLEETFLAMTGDD